jgi:Zn-dependent protease with chaperone function
MPPLPESSSTPNAHAELEAGLTAFQQGNYAQAIARLTSTPVTPNHPLAVKSQMALVIAYTRTEQPDRAIGLCQRLQQSGNPQLKAWATSTLTRLTKRFPNQGELPRPADLPLQPEPDLTGFVPFESPTAPPQSTPVAAIEPQPISPLASAPGLPSESLPAPPQRQSADPSEPFQPVWRHVDRLSQGQSLGKIKRFKLVLAQFGTAIALFWMAQTITYRGFNFLITGLTRLEFLRFRSVITTPPTWSIGVGLLALFLASRWLLDALLTWKYGMRSLSAQRLRDQSPEAAQVLHRVSRQQRYPFPALGLLPVAEPIAFSYGCLPRFTRIVVSQGLLDQLADDEIAAIYANESGHLTHWTTPLMSLVTVLLQLPYTLYALTAEWGNRKPAIVTKLSAALIAAVSYGIYALFRWVALWLSRQRVYFSDRAVAELTGNPNGYTRALLKLAIGTANTVQAQGQTSYLSEGFDLLTPLGHQMAITLGSVYPHTPLEPVLAWDWQQPLRHWLALNNSHPPTGDRLRLLGLYAQHWKLHPELDFSQAASQTAPHQPRLPLHQWRTMFFQGAPFFGAAIGLVVAYLFSLTGWVGVRLGFLQLIWMYGQNSLVWGLPLIGFSLGTFLRINAYFPDIVFFGTQTAETAPTLPVLLSNPEALPIPSPTVRLEGTLLGRPGMSNDLSQDLLLQTETGVVRLHWLSAWGPIGNLVPRGVRPSDLLNQPVTLTGWFRRGATPWIDIETLRTRSGRVHHSHHPLWSALVAIGAAIWGIWAIAFG